MRVWTVSLWLGITSLAACSSRTEENATASQDDALRTLTAQEILGTIVYGDTKQIAYTENPRYRAFSFQGKSGDAIDIRVHAKTAGTDPIAWLLGSTFQTLQRNDNENNATRDSRIQKTLTKTDTYYVVVRESNLEAATFDVSLNVPAFTPPPPPPPPPGNSVDVFALVPYTEVLTREELLKYYAPGAATAKLGGFGVATRQRACTASTGCAAWIASKYATFYAHRPSKTAGYEPYTDTFAGNLYLGLYYGLPTVQISTSFAGGYIFTTPTEPRQTYYNAYYWVHPGTLVDSDRSIPIHDVTGYELRDIGFYVYRDAYRSNFTNTGPQSWEHGGPPASAPSSGAFTEYQYALYGRTNPNEKVTLREANGTVYADW